MIEDANSIIWNDGDDDLDLADEERDGQIPDMDGAHEFLAAMSPAVRNAVRGDREVLKQVR